MLTFMVIILSCDVPKSKFAAPVQMIVSRRTMLRVPPCMTFKVKREFAYLKANSRC